MISKNSIGVVVPAYNEARLLPSTLAGIPDFVDHVVVVDDGSSEGKLEEVVGADDRVTVVRHTANQGVGAAIVTGYRWCRQRGLDVAAVMAADNQMHPDDLRPLLVPILEDSSDYVCGDRLAWPRGWTVFPRARLFGVVVLAAITRWVTGLGFIRDAQCGYTAIRVASLDRVDLEAVYPRYGFPNDLLAKAAQAGLRVSTEAVRPVYADEKSKLRIARVILPILRLSWANWRLRQRQTRPVRLPSAPADVNEGAVEEEWAGEPAA